MHAQAGVPATTARPAPAMAITAHLLSFHTILTPSENRIG
jgi:hypothetical protein